MPESVPKWHLYCGFMEMFLFFLKLTDHIRGAFKDKCDSINCTSL